MHKHILKITPRSIVYTFGMASSPLAPAELTADQSLRQETQAVGQQMQQAVGAVLDRLAEAGVRDQKAMQAALQLSQSAVSRLLTSVRGADPLAALCVMPGTEALRQMRRGAAKAGVATSLLRGVDEAVQRFEAFVEQRIGDRSALDSILRDWVQESRGSFELRHKAAAFKSMSALRGVQAELVLTAGILVPSAAGDATHDCLGIDAVLGCRRTRPSGLLHLHGYTMPPVGTPYQITDLDGRPIDSMADTLIPAFSTLQPAQVHTQRHGDLVATQVSTLPLGRGAGAGVDLVFGQWIRGVHRRRRMGGRPTAGLGGQAEPPAVTYVVDALLDDAVWPGVEPSLALYDTVVRGVAHPDDPLRDGDRLDMVETLQFLGRGPESFRMPEFPRYPALVRHVCARAGVDPERLRGYRCKVRFPVYGAQIGIGFPLPE